MSSEEAVMWVEKYRPQTLDDVANQTEAVESLKILIRTPATIPHLLFAGPPGTGKTTAGLCVARQVLGKGWREFTLELNASDERGISTVRERIKTFSQYAKAPQGKVSFGFVILDECDELTSDAQTALRRIMETSSRTSRFLLICNYQSAIIEPIQSRCAVFRFVTLKEKDVIKHLKYIGKEEDLTTHEDALKAISDFAEGDLRKAINTLQAAAAYAKGKSIDEKIVLQVVGQADPKQVQAMMQEALKGNFMKARDSLYELMTAQGFSGKDIIRQMHRELLRTTDLAGEEQAELVRILGDYDFRLSQGANEDIQLSALLAQLASVKAK